MWYGIFLLWYRKYTETHSREWFYKNYEGEVGAVCETEKNSNSRAEYLSQQVTKQN